LRKFLGSKRHQNEHNLAECLSIERNEIIFGKYEVEKKKQYHKNFKKLSFPSCFVEPLPHAPGRRDAGADLLGPGSARRGDAATLGAAATPAVPPATGARDAVRGSRVVCEIL